MNMNTISAITISAICTTVTLLLLSQNQSVVSAWTIYTTNNNNKLVYPSISRRWSSHRIANHYHSTTVLYSTTPDDIDDEDIINNGNIEEVDIISERKRKRDIFKRTLGLSSSLSSSSDTDGNSSNNEVKKLNTDNLFKGMPPINSILGTSSSTNIVGNMPEDLSSPQSNLPSMPPQSSTPPQSTNKQTQFEKQGQLRKELDLLTPSEKAELESKYNSMKLESEGLVSDELEKGSDGNLGKFYAV